MLQKRLCNVRSTFTTFTFGFFFSIVGSCLFTIRIKLFRRLPDLSWMGSLLHTQKIYVHPLLQQTINTNLYFIWIIFLLLPLQMDIESIEFSFLYLNQYFLFSFNELFLIYIILCVCASTTNCFMDEFLGSFPQDLTHI